MSADNPTISPLANLEELLRVAHSLEPDKVDMETWAHISGPTAQDVAYERQIDEDGFESDYDIIIPVRPCGSTACLMGHAALDEHFIKQGIELRWRIIHDHIYEDTETEIAGSVVKAFQAMVCNNVSGEVLEEGDREELFGLPNGIYFEAAHKGWLTADDFLFMPYSYVSDENKLLKGQELKDAIIEHVTRVLDYIKSPETTEGWTTREKLTEGYSDNDEEILVTFSPTDSEGFVNVMLTT